MSEYEMNSTTNQNYHNINISDYFYNSKWDDLEYWLNYLDDYRSDNRSDYRPEWYWEDEEELYPVSPWDYDPYYILKLNVASFCLSAICQVIVCGFGMVANVINMLVFYRQGILTDSCTACLAALAVSDFCVCVLKCIQGLIRIPYYMAELGYASHEELGYYLGIVNSSVTLDPLFVKTTSWITIYIALERMVSVTFPFHVKLIFNARRSCIAMAAIFLTSVIIDLPTYIPYTFSFENKSTLQILHEIWDVLDNYVLRASSIFILIVLNVIIVVNVIRAKRFRKESTTNKADVKVKIKIKETVSVSGQTVKLESEKVTESRSRSKKDENNVNKELKLAIMITVLSVAYFCSYSILGIMRAIAYMYVNKLIPPVSLRASMLVENVGRFLEAMNSSCNIIIYYTMSTKYKRDLRQFLKTCFNFNDLEKTM